MNSSREAACVARMRAWPRATLGPARRTDYDGQFYPGPHRFDVGMQEVAFAWLREVLAQR